MTFSRYSATARTNSAWLHVKGDTEIGDPSKGFSCSARIPDFDACLETHWIRSIAFFRCSVFSAEAMCHLASQRVHIIQGFPWKFIATRWYRSFSYLATPPSSELTHSVSTIAFMVCLTSLLLGSKAPYKNVKESWLSIVASIVASGRIAFMNRPRF